MMRKTILITGSTDGIGKLTALKLAKDKHEIYIHGRNPEKIAAAISEIKAKTKNQNMDGFTADFSNLNSVKQMAEQINEKLSKLDVLINNAGVYNNPESHNKEGLDIRFVVNYLAPYLLTNALLPLLQKGTDSRIVNLSSSAQSTVFHSTLLGKTKQPARATYAQSKLALTMWSFYLSKKEPDIAVIAVNPGSLLNTKMVRDAFGRSFASADKGADILYELAISKDYKGITGNYFDNDIGGFGHAHSDTYNETEIEKLISTTKTLIE